MGTVLKQDIVTGPLGEFEVSTIRTYSGGGENTSMFGFISFGFKDSDFAEDSPWPFETMVFRSGSRTGLYHAPFATEQEAISHHKLMVETVRKGLEFGGGVSGPWGTPSMTPEEWEAKSKSAARR